MSQYIVGCEGEAEVLLAIITRMMSTKPEPSLPTQIDVFVPSVRFRKCLINMIEHHLLEHKESLQSQQKHMHLRLITPGETNDDGIPT